MQQPPAHPRFSTRSTPIREEELARAERRGKQVLLYAAYGPLGGAFACARCGAGALQPDLLDHRADCPYRSQPGR